MRLKRQRNLFTGAAPESELPVCGATCSAYRPPHLRSMQSTARPATMPAPRSITPGVLVTSRVGPCWPPPSESRHALQPRAQPRRRKRSVVNLIRDALDPRPHFGQIGGRSQSEQVRLVRRRIEEINLAKLVVHQRIPLPARLRKSGPLLCSASVTLLVAGSYLNIPSRPCVRKKIHLVAHIHRQSRKKISWRNLHRIKSRQRSDPDRTRAPSVIVAPRHNDV